MRRWRTRWLPRSRDRRAALVDGAARRRESAGGEELARLRGAVAALARRIGRAYVRGNPSPALLERLDARMARLKARIRELEPPEDEGREFLPLGLLRRDGDGRP